MAAASSSTSITTPDGYDPATMALVAFLRCEADLAETKARSMRAQAQRLAEIYGITDDLQQRYEIDPDQLPPLDEHGIPKYKGKKRGRKPKARKRKLNPNRRKRQHTAYTLFVKENYPLIKAQHPTWFSKDCISLVAKQWKQVPADEKKEWKVRAQATHDSADEEEEGEEEEEEEEEGAVEEEEEEEVEEDEEPMMEEDEQQQQQGYDEYVTAAQPSQDEEDDEEEAAPPARRRGRKK